MAKAYRPPFPAYRKDSAFNDLAALMRSSRPPIVLVGAGASASSGYPAWSDLLVLLKEAALADNKADWRRSLEDLSDAPWVAEVFADKLPGGGLTQFIRKHFAERKPVREPHRTLARLPFPHFLTTNYDPSIELALRAAGKKFRTLVWPASASGHADVKDIERLSSFLIRLSERGTERHVLYLHGRFDSPEERIILTERDYVARYIASDDARRKLMAIFMTHPVLFVGFSMNDPDLSNLMREVTARLRSKKPCHYALMGYKGEADREAISARMIRKFGVRPVFYSRTPVDAGGDEYSNLVHLLHALAGRAEKTAEPVKAAPVTAAFDPDDPNKGRFGGSALANGRALKVVTTGGSKAEEILELALVVEPDGSGSPALQGKVEFHLHPSFDTTVYVERVKDGRAVLSEVMAWGAFTVGAVADGGKTRLELDLAEVSSLPLWFRRR